MARRLRSGYTTGACAAAAAKAALLTLLGKAVDKVEIPFPDRSRHSFEIIAADWSGGSGRATVIKDAGDDPDVTNGARISARVWLWEPEAEKPAGAVECDGVLLCGGAGVGRASKPGLAVRPGEAAINPVPRQMIVAALREVVAAPRRLRVEISVADGEKLAEKTLNGRLGIIGGLSILGTTGIVRPISAEAWVATITASMSVARECGCDEIVLSTGRTSERGAQAILNLPVEAYAMMGDYLEFSLLEAAKHGFRLIHLAGMWAKITKAALEVPQTHVRNGALEMRDAAALLARLGATGELLGRIEQANTARQMYELLAAAGKRDIIRAVCAGAAAYGRKVAGCPVRVYLVDSRATVIEQL